MNNFFIRINCLNFFTNPVAIIIAVNFRTSLSDSKIDKWTPMFIFEALGYQFEISANPISLLLLLSNSECVNWMDYLGDNYAIPISSNNIIFFPLFLLLPFLFSSHLLLFWFYCFPFFFFILLNILATFFTLSNNNYNFWRIIW